MSSMPLSGSFRLRNSKGKAVSGSLIPISDEQAKLAQEILKTFRGLGAFIEKALGSTPEDLIAYFGGDRLRVRRAENIARLFQEARQRVADRHVEEPIPASLSVALPLLLQGAADEDREELVDLWARLLANAMDPRLNSVRYSFIEAVKKMDPLDAVVLKTTNYDGNLVVIRNQMVSRESHTTDVKTIADKLQCRRDEVLVSLHHLQEMDFFQTHPAAAGGGPDYFVTSINREFMRACYPSNEV